MLKVFIGPHFSWQSAICHAWCRLSVPDVKQSQFMKQ